MFEINVIDLTSLLCNTWNESCKNPAHEHEDPWKCEDRMGPIVSRVNEILNILDSKDSSVFSYRAPDYKRSNSFEDFKTATHYHYDENTLHWITNQNKAGPMRKALIEKLIEAGIIKYSQGNHINKGSQLVGEMMRIESDENLAWLIFIIGLQPPPLSYAYYGFRKDRSFQQKLRMFEVLHSRCKLIPECNIISHCFEFSNQIEEVKSFIQWF